MEPKMMQMVDLLPRDSELRELIVEPELMRMRTAGWATAKTPPAALALPFALKADTTNRLAPIVQYLKTMADDETAPEEDRECIRQAIELLTKKDGATAAPKKELPKKEPTARTTKPAVASKTTATRAAKPVVAPKKEETTMNKTMTMAESREAFAKLARTAKRENEREGAEQMVRWCDEQLDPKLAAQRTELDRKMGLHDRTPLAVQNGARHGLRTMTPDEARREIDRRASAGTGVR